MSTVYYYYVGAPVDISTRVTTLNNKISTDLDLPIANYTSTVYNSGTENVEITFTVALNSFYINILNSLCSIILYDGSVENTVYVGDVNSNDRRSFGVTNPPTNNSDSISGYSPGSVVATLSNDLYFCVDNTQSNAVWKKITPRNYALAVRSSATSTTISTVSPGYQVVFTSLDALTDGWTLTGTSDGLVTPNTGTYKISYTSQNNHGTSSSVISVAMSIGAATAGFVPSSMASIQQSLSSIISSTFQVNLNSGDIISFYVLSNLTGQTLVANNFGAFGSLNINPAFTVSIVRIS